VVQAGRSHVDSPTSTEYILLKVFAMT